MVKIFDSDFLKKLESIAIKSRMLMTEGAGGNRKSRSKGSSVEFSDFREYSAGDDFRRIDWNAYGRLDKLFIKLFMEEREATINIFIDCSKSMDFGSIKKWDTGLKLSSIITYLALGNMDRVCLNIMKDGGLRQSQSITGRASFDRCIKFLENIAFSGNTDINKCVKLKEFHNRGISVIVSDFFTPKGIEESIKYLLFKKQDIILIHVLANEEINPFMEGQVKLVDSETGSLRDVAVTPAVLKRYQQELERFMNNIKEYANKMGATYIQVSSEQPIEKIVFEEFTKAGII